MGKVKSPVGHFRGRVGNIYYRYDRGNTYMCNMPVKYTDAKEPEQLIQRAIWSKLSEYVSTFKEAYRLGLKWKKDVRVNNHFFLLNVKNVEVDENYVASLDIEKIKVSDGNLLAPNVSISMKDGIVRFSKSSQPTQYNSFVSDTIHVVLYEKEINKAIVVDLGTRGSSGSSTCDVPKGWNGDNIVCYVFAVTKNKKDASITLFIVPEIEN